MIPEFEKHLTQSGIAYTREGAGPVLLLVHGVGLRAESWSPMIDRLTDCYDVIAIDLPGHGASAQSLFGSFSDGAPNDVTNAPSSAAYSSLDDYVNNIHEFITELGLLQYFVCGHSLGALIAIEMAARWPNQVSGLIALNAVYQRSDEALLAVQQRAKNLRTSTSIIGIEQTISRWFGKSPTGELKQYADWCSIWLKANSLHGYANAYTVFAAGKGPAPQKLASITCPAIYMTGRLDPNSSAAMSKEMAELAPQASSSVVDDAAHMMPLTHADDVANVVIALGLSMPAHTSNEPFLKEANQ